MNQPSSYQVRLLSLALFAIGVIIVIVVLLTPGNQPLPALVGGLLTGTGLVGIALI